VDQKPAISFGSYYGAAIPRAFWAGWDWAFGQGLGLTILLGCGAVASAAVYALIRAWRRSHSWADARKGVRHATADFLISGVGAIVIVLVGLFVWFFVNDAPTQIESLREKLVALSPPSPTALVDKWLLASDNSTIKALVPAEMFEDWETKKHTADELTERLPSPLAPQVPQEMLQDVESKKHRLDDLTHQRKELAAQQLGYGKKPPSPSADIGGLILEVERAQRELTEAEARVNKYVDPIAEKATNERNKAEYKRNEAKLWASATKRRPVWNNISFVNCWPLASLLPEVFQVTLRHTIMNRSL